MYWKYRYDVTKQKGEKIKAPDDFNLFGQGMVEGGVYYNDEGNWVYPIASVDESMFNHQSDDVWYICAIPKVGEEIKYGVECRYYHQNWHEYNPKTKGCNFTKGIEGPVQFSRNRATLNLRVGQRITLNNLITAIVTEVLNPGFIVEIADNDYCEGTLRLNKQGNAVNDPECLSKPQEFKMGWFNFMCIS